MKYRFLICSIFDDAPTATNDEVLAKKLADLAQDWYVLDLSTFKFLPPFEDGAEIEEEDPTNWD